MENLWQAILAELETELTPTSFKIWFTNTRQHEVKQSDGVVRLVVGCPSGFVEDTIRSRFLKKIQQIGKKITNKELQVSFLVEGEVKDKTSRSLFTPPLTRRQERVNLNPDYTFETFVVGPSNQVAVAAAMAIAQNPGKMYNPFFLFGGVGLGKTHLIQAIAHRIKKDHPDLKILYTSSEEFTNDLIGALRKQQMERYKNIYRKVDVLLIDDIQFIAGKTFVQEEFFHTFNSLYLNNKQVIVTADSPPDEIEGLPQRVISRFKGGLAIDVQSLDYETRRGILEKKLQEKGVDIDEKIKEIIANHPFENAREIEGFILKLETIVRLQGKQVDEELVGSLLGKTQGGANRVSPRRILKLTADFFGVTVRDIKGKSRQSKIALARHVTVYLCRNELNMSYVAIGRLLGGRDHSTIIHSVEKVDKMFKTNDLVRQAIISAKGELNR